MGANGSRARRAGLRSRGAVEAAAVDRALPSRAARADTSRSRADAAPGRRVGLAPERRVRPPRQRGAVPLRPGGERDRALPRPAATRMVRHRRHGGDGHASARPREPARRARWGGRGPGDAGGDDARPRPSPGRRPGRCGGVLGRRIRARRHGATRTRVRSSRPRAGTTTTSGSTPGRRPARRARRRVREVSCASRSCSPTQPPWTRWASGWAASRPSIGWRAACSPSIRRGMPCSCAREPAARAHNQSSSSATPSTTASGRRLSGSRPRSIEPLIPLRTRIVRPRPRRPSATSRSRSSPITTSVAGRHPDLLGDRPERGPGGLPHDDRTRAGDLRDRGSDHRAAAEDRPVRSGVGRDEAAGQQWGAGDHGTGRALELGEVDDVGVRDEDRVCALAGPPRPGSVARPAPGTRVPRRCRTGAPRRRVRARGGTPGRSAAA